MQYSKEEKEMFLEDWKQSGKSAWAYAKANGLNIQTFSNWIKKNEKSEQCFVEIPRQLLTPPRNEQEILIEKGDVRIRIPLSIGIVGVRAVMEGLGGAL